ncbi:MAG TPA: flagellin lysine-N-methylase, partial [Polyangiaceae bacterium]|nr:flagellin lysine-N-methylase [Polyangiaceae bacterium]
RPKSTTTAYRYMTRFRCIGSECESSCCTAGWSIFIDRASYQKTERAMAGDPETRREFDAKLKRVKDVTSSNAKYALTVLDEHGSCALLRPDGLCSLQTRYGEEVLSDTCAIYPRSVAISGQRLELTGMTSCPEVARQLLLHPDAMERVEVSRELIGRHVVHTRLGERPDKPYLRYHEELRSLMLQLLSDAAYPLSVRLSFMAYFAHRTVPLLQRDARSLDDRRLLAEVERIQNAAFRADLHREFAALAVDPVVSAQLVLGLLAARARVAGFQQFAGEVLAEYLGKPCPEELEGEAARARARELLAAYLRRKSEWSSASARIDGYFTNYAKNYWAREWYMHSPNLLAHAVQLLLRVAAMRFLLLGRAGPAAIAEADEDARVQALDRAVVRTVQQFSRAFEHDPSFAGHLQGQLSSSGVISLAHAACLAAF